MEKRFKKKNHAQLELSFSMIFSIILIIVFLVFAFWAIKKFLVFGDLTEITKFKDSIQGDVDNIWRGQQGSWTPAEGYLLPKKIQYVCFVDFFSGAKGFNKEFYTNLNQANSGGDENMAFYPVGSAQGLDSTKINHLNIANITENDNPYCIKNNGRVKLTISKNYGENLVTITRNG